MATVGHAAFAADAPVVPAAVACPVPQGSPGVYGLAAVATVAPVPAVPVVAAPPAPIAPAVPALSAAPVVLPLLIPARSTKAKSSEMYAGIETLQMYISDTTCLFYFQVSMFPHISVFSTYPDTVLYFLYNIFRNVQK